MDSYERATILAALGGVCVGASGVGGPGGPGGGGDTRPLDNEDVTEGNSDRQTSIEGLALLAVSNFTSLQQLIDDGARTYFQKRTPHLEKFVYQRALKRMTDDERIDVLKSIALDLEVPNDLSSFAAVYRRCKKVRDTIAHSARINISGDDSITLDRSFISTPETRQKGEAEAIELTLEELANVNRELEWLRQHVQTITLTRLQGGTPLMWVDGKYMEFELLVPPASPADWDGIWLRPIGEYVPKES